MQKAQVRIESSVVLDAREPNEKNRPFGPIAGARSIPLVERDCGAGPVPAIRAILAVHGHRPIDRAGGRIARGRGQLASERREEAVGRKTSRAPLALSLGSFRESLAVL